MSGGSFDYLYGKDIDEMRPDTLAQMSEALGKLAQGEWKGEVAKAYRLAKVRTDDVLERLHGIWANYTALEESLGEFGNEDSLRTVWKEIEWLCSNDSGPTSAAKVLVAWLRAQESVERTYRLDGREYNAPEFLRRLSGTLVSSPWGSWCWRGVAEDLRKIAADLERTK